MVIVHGIYMIPTYLIPLMETIMFFMSFYLFEGADFHFYFHKHKSCKSLQSLFQKVLNIIQMKRENKDRVSECEREEDKYYLFDVIYYEPNNTKVIKK